VTGDWNRSKQRSAGVVAAGPLGMEPERSRERKVRITRPRHYLPAPYASVPKGYLTRVLCYLQEYGL